MNSKSELEYQLHHIQKQLKSMKTHNEFLSEKMKTYRYRWLESYHHTDNLECHMLDGIEVPSLDQIQENAPSPGYFTDLLGSDHEGPWSERTCTDLWICRSINLQEGLVVILSVTKHTISDTLRFQLNHVLIIEQYTYHVVKRVVYLFFGIWLIMSTSQFCT